MELSYTREIYHSHKLFLVSMDLLEMFKKINLEKVSFLELLTKENLLGSFH